MLVKYDDGYLYNGWYIEGVGGFCTIKHWIATKVATIKLDLRLLLG